MITGTRLILIALGAATWLGCSDAPDLERRKESTSNLFGFGEEELTDVLVAPAAIPPAIDITPANGTTFSKRTAGQSVTFSGFTAKAGQTVEVQVLSTAGAAVEEANWVTVATATTESTGTNFNDPEPIFRWTVTAVPAADESRWPSGGLLRFRSIVTDAGAKTALPFFDHTSGDCIKTVATKSWKEVLKTCKSPFSPDLGAKLDATTGARAAALVSTQGDPTNRFFVPPYLTRKGFIFEVETEAYYLRVLAPRTLQEYQLRYGFLKGDAASALYYNKGDLGIGREMHCQTFKNVFGSGTACYVRNYGVDFDNQPDFSGDPHSAMFDAVRGQNSFATVAMVKFGDKFAPADGNDVQFFVYDANDQLANKARLDTIGVNQSIPSNCINCHGGEYDRTKLKLTGSSFLPFDPQAFLFPTRQGFTYADQEDEIRKLNVITRDAGAPPSTVQLVNGWYGGKADVEGTKMNFDWAPKGWSATPEAKTVYRELYKPYCRTCHVSQVGDFAFASYEDFKGEAKKSEESVCQTAEMPIAEATLHQFWQGSGRAYAVNSLNLSNACAGKKK